MAMACKAVQTLGMLTKQSYGDVQQRPVQPIHWEFCRASWLLPSFGQSSAITVVVQSTGEHKSCGNP